MNLYSRYVPATSFTVAFQIGLSVVYPAADIATAWEVFHFPSSAMDPMSLMLSSQAVVTLWLKETETVEAGVQVEVVREEVLVVDEGVGVVAVVVNSLAP